MHVLLIEDSEDDAVWIREALNQSFGGTVEIEQATRLATGLVRAAAASFDVILLDLSLPDSHGIETFLSLRDRLAKRPVIVLSGLEDEAVATTAVREGAQDYLVKGQVDPPLLARSIRYAIGRHVAESALRQSEETARAIVENALDGVISMNVEGTITGWNRQAEAIFGWEPQVVIGRRLSELIIPPRFRTAHDDGLKRFLATGEGRLLQTRMETVGLHREGHEIPLELSIFLTPLGGQTAFSAFVRDITERKRVDRLQSAQVALSLILAESVTLEDAAPRVLQAIGEIVDWELGALWLPDPRGLALSCLALWHAPRHNPGPFEEAKQRRSFRPGAGLPGRAWSGKLPVWVRDVTEDPEFALASQARAAGFHTGFAVPILFQEEVLAVLEFFSVKIRQDDAEVFKLMGHLCSQVAQFIERKRLEAQLRHAHKVEAVGQLAGGIAHDFNNLLTGINGYSEMLLATLDKDDPMHHGLELIHYAGERAAALTRQLLAFSRKQVLVPEVLDLNVHVSQMERLLKRVIGEDIRLEIHTEPELGRAKADPGQIEQVILNLAVNARDAMPNGGVLTIETRNVEVDDAAPVPGFTGRGSFIVLTVRDTGCGMEEHVRERIFEPFFTTKEHGKGTGLGLATCYGIVKQSGGHISVDTCPGMGSTFTVYLPRVDADAPPEAEGPGMLDQLNGSETILLVEDEPIVRNLARTLLQAHGYRVLEADDGANALRVSHQHAGTIHLLLTDTVMPGLNGRDLAKQLSASRPDIVVLYMSGYTDKAIIQHGMLEPGVHFLQKPFKARELAAKVREVLSLARSEGQKAEVQ